MDEGFALGSLVFGDGTPCRCLLISLQCRHATCYGLAAKEDLDVFSTLLLCLSFLCEAFEALLAAFQRFCILPLSICSFSCMLQLYPGRLMALLIQSRAVFVSVFLMLQDLN